MRLKVIVHEAEEGGYWAEVPAILGCATQGETVDELLLNLHEAVEACLSVDLQKLNYWPQTRYWSLLFEIRFWKSICSIAGKSMVAANPCQW